MAKFRGIPRLAKDVAPDRIVIDAVDDANYGILAKVKRGLDYFITMARPRSRKHENWYRGLCRVVAEGIGRNPDLLYEELKMECGEIKRTYISKRWGPMAVVRSATEMADYEYKKLTDEAVDFILVELLPGTKKHDLMDEVVRRCGPRPT